MITYLLIITMYITGCVCVLLPLKHEAKLASWKRLHLSEYLMKYKWSYIRKREKKKVIFEITYCKHKNENFNYLVLNSKLETKI